MKVLKNLIKSFVLLMIGGFIYVMIEILFRGYSHWSMFLAGGLSFVLIGLINEVFDWKTSFVLQCIIGGLIITIIEFIVGCIVNIKLGWHVWDYSNQPLNLWGQICLGFSLIWTAIISPIAIVLDDFLRWKLFNEEKPHYRL